MFVYLNFLRVAKFSAFGLVATAICRIGWLVIDTLRFALRRYLVPSTSSLLILLAALATKSLGDDKSPEAVKFFEKIGRAHV